MAAEANFQVEPGANSTQSGRQFPVAFAIGAVLVLILAGGVVLLSRTIRTNTPAPVALPFGAGESAYAPKIQFQDLQLARSTNMLNQEFTYVAGTFSNGGDRSVAGLEATFEFHDQFKQVVLRESRQLIAPPAPPLAAGGQQPFQIVLEHVPADWNQQNPSIRITGLVLQ